MTNMLNLEARTLVLNFFFYSEVWCVTTYLPFGSLRLQPPSIKWSTTFPQSSWEAFRGYRRLYLNHADRLSNMVICLIYLFMWLDRLLHQIFLYCTLASPQGPESRDWLTNFLLPSLDSIQHLPLKPDIEVKMQLWGLLEMVCALFEHFSAIIHQTGLLTKMPDMHSGMGQKGPNPFLAIFIFQCVLIILLCQTKRFITKRKWQTYFQVTTHFKPNQQWKPFSQEKQKHHHYFHLSQDWKSAQNML